MNRWSFAHYLVLVFLFASNAQAEWSVEILTGTAHNFSTTLEIEEGENILRLETDYETRGFQSPLYYSLRAGYWVERHGWEIEFIHHKLFLENPIPPLQRFSISHGYNYFLINYGWKFYPFILRAGAGFILAHPEVDISGSFAEPGYELTGPAGQLGAGFRFPLSKSLFISAEGKWTFARAHVSILNGEASAPNVALHALFGIGFEL